MPSTASTPGTATAILAAAGVKEDVSYYGSFLDEREKLVLTVPIRIQDAWLHNDADAFARVFTDNGSLLMQDHQLRGRDEIHAYMAAGFAGGLRGASVKGWPLSVTFLRDDVAALVTEGGIRLPGETETARERQIRAVWVVVRQGEDWRLVSHQSSPIYG
ncbi:SgcJ/EcaC family oxidoreductase [Salinispora pacifica]|uniref:SgcJ/EcaC family oxidoreductase n=1 Tax=Salinispora pacifica TaxID=351187 RepID=UPI0003A37BB6|nr:SgcJ/EcaC family oxidoreductase [Salinispora pacifica]